MTANSDSKVFWAIRWLSSFLVDLGDEGFAATFGQPVSLQSLGVQIIMFTALVVGHVFVVLRLWRWINNRGAEATEEHDSAVPSAAETQQWTTVRLTPE